MTLQVSTTMSTAGKNNSTMRRSKRDIGSVYGSLGEPLSEKKVKAHSGDVLQRLTKVSINELKPDELIWSYFQQMIPHIWFRLLPSEGGKCETVAFAMGQEW